MPQSLEEDTMNFLQGKSMAIDLPRLFIWGLMLSLSVLVLQTGCMTVQDAVTGDSTYNLFSMEEEDRKSTRLNSSHT